MGIVHKWEYRSTSVRSICSQMFFKIGVLKFRKFRRKTVGGLKSATLSKRDSNRTATLLKRDPTQVFSYEICKIFKSTYFEEHLRWLLLVCIHACFTQCGGQPISDLCSLSITLKTRGYLMFSRVIQEEHQSKMGQNLY